jgi:hypothetical protein
LIEHAIVRQRAVVFTSEEATVHRSCFAKRSSRITVAADDLRKFRREDAE